jgi:hypothetical protein
LKYSAKISRTGGSLKNLFVTPDKDIQIKSDFNHYQAFGDNHATLESAEDILEAWLDGLNEPEFEEDNE